MASTAAGRLHIDVNGVLRLWRNGSLVELRPKERSVLAAIVFSHPRSVDASALASLVWGDRPPETSRKSIHNHVARIRNVADGLVVTSTGGYSLSPTVTLEPVGRSSDEPFSDLADSIDVTIERARIRTRFDAIEDARLEQLVRVDDEDAIPALRHATSARPLNERRWWLFAYQLARRGQRRESLLAFAEARGHLVDVGLVLDTQLVQLEQLVVGDDPSRLNASLIESALGQRSATVPTVPTVPPVPTVPTVATEASGERPIHPHHRDPFVGRLVELEQMRSMWDDVVQRWQPQLMLITGPAGSGKTRLADAFTRAARVDSSGVRVMLGRSRQSVNRAYGTLTESFGGAVALEPSLVERLGSRLAGLAGVVPTLAGVDRADTIDDAFRRTRLVESTRLLLEEMGRTPTIWCLDDVQWASPETIGVVESALDGLDGQLMVIATTRSADGAIAEALAALQRAIPARTLPLPPLSVHEVAQLFDIDPESRSAAAFARTVHARTGGHALYASEIARVARLERTVLDPASVPPAIREWVMRRVSGLDPDVRSTLQLAAVIGERFDAATVARASDADERTVAAHCDALLAAGFLSATPLSSSLSLSSSSLSLRERTELGFAHAVTHEIVYEQLGVANRTCLHADVANALMADAIEREVEPNHADLAHHLARAGASKRMLASAHARLAGHDDFRAGGWSSAAHHYATAVDLAQTESARAEALVDYGRAELRAERFDSAAMALLGAIEIARLHGLAFVQADATMALVGRAGRGASIDADEDDQIHALRAALRVLDRLRPADQAESRRRAISMSGLERELAFSLLLSDAADERRELLGMSVARMRNLVPIEPRALANALLGARYEKLAPERLTERLADIDEVLAMRVDQLGHEVVLAAHCYQIEDLLRAGQIDEAGVALDDAEFISDRFPNPYWRWAIRAWRGVYALVGGDLDRAESTAASAYALRLGVPEAEACLGVNLVNFRLYQGRSAEVVPALRWSAAHSPGVPLYGAVLALCLVESGDAVSAREAQALLDGFAASEFDALPDDTNRFTGLAVLAHVAADLGDSTVASLLIRLLTPYADQWVVLSAYGGGGAVWGPVSHALARLALLLGDEADAARSFARAVSQAARSPVVRDRIEHDRAALSR